MRRKYVPESWPNKALSWVTEVFHSVSFKPYSARTNGVQGCYKNVTEVALKCTNDLRMGNMYDDSVNSFNQKIPISSEVLGSSYSSKGMISSGLSHTVPTANCFATFCFLASFLLHDFKARKMKQLALG